MTVERIASIVAAGESEVLEFKSTTGTRREATQTVCAMLNKRNPGYRGRETAFMKRALTVPRFRQRVLVRPQVDMLVDESGEVGMDYVGRYETLQQGFGEVCRQIGIAEIDLERSNVSEHDAYASYYDDELLANVTAFYLRDFEMLGYDP